MEMEPLTLKWAKVSPKTFNKLFPLEGTPKELKEALDRMEPIRKGSFHILLLEFKELPESQWETTFAQKMTHLPEYQNLHRALINFRKDIYNETNSTK